VGWYGFEIADGSRAVAIEHCTIRNMGAGGVKVNGSSANDPVERRTGDHAITDNDIHAGGRVFHSAVGVLIMDAFNTEVSHNLIHDLYYTGISCGWVWGYMESVARYNRIEKNHIHTIGQGVLSDMGGIYTLGVQPGTVIRGNLIHGVRMAHYGGWCIYPDEGSSHILIENNVCYDADRNAFHQHYGRENIVRNNIFAFGRENQLQRTRMESHRSFTFEGNILYWTEGGLLGSNWSDDKYLFDRNVYWAGGREVRFGPWSFEEWKKRGQDLRSTIADPLFVDPEKFDFNLRPDSPALKLGFVPIDLRNVGPRPGAGR
jgi:hypothetical protein